MKNRTPPRRALCALAFLLAGCVASAMAAGSRASHADALAPSFVEAEAAVGVEMMAAARLRESDQCDDVDPNLFLVGGKPQGGSKNFKLDPLHLSTIHSFDQLTSAMKAEEAAKKHEHLVHKQRMAALHKARAEEEKREEKEDHLDLAKIEAEVYAAEDRKHRERGQPVGEDDLMLLETAQAPRGVPSGVARAVMSTSNSGEFDRREVRPDSMPSAVSASAQSGQRYTIKDSPQPIEAVREALVRAATASISSMLSSASAEGPASASSSESAGPSQAAAMDAVLRELMEADKANEASSSAPPAAAPSADAVIAQAVARAQSPAPVQVKSVEDQWPNPYKYAVSKWSNSPSKKDLEAQRKFDEWRREGHKGDYRIEYHGNDGPCCEGLKCPFENGVCCISLNACCPEGSECTRNAYGAVLCRRQQRFPKKQAGSSSGSSSQSQSGSGSSQSVQSQSWSSSDSLSSAWHPAASESLSRVDLPPMATAQSQLSGSSSSASASGSQAMSVSSESSSELPLGSWRRLARARKELWKLRHVKNFDPNQIDVAVRQARINEAVAQQKLDLVKEFDLTLGNYKLYDDNDNDYQRKGNPYKTHRNYYRRVPRNRAKTPRTPARAAPTPAPVPAPSVPVPTPAPYMPPASPAPSAPAPMSDLDSALATVAAMAQGSLLELDTLPPAKAKKLGPKKQKTKVTINVVPDPDADKIDINARLGTFQDDDDLNEDWRDQLKEDIDVAQLLRQPYCYAETKKGIIRTMLTPISCLNFTTKLNTFGSWALDSAVADPAALMAPPAPGYGGTEPSKFTDVLGATTVSRTEFKAFNFGPDTTWTKAQEKCVTAGFAGLCPAELVCEPSAKDPNELEVNSVLQKLPVRNNMWVPIADEENEWMQANPSDHRACERYSRTFGDKPVWGNDPTTPKTVRGAVLCCKNVFIRSTAFFPTTPSRVCWGNKKNTFATINVKGGGKYIEAVRLEHFSGGHACLARHTPERFGCDGYINTYLASNDSTPQVIYPQTNEPGVIFKPFARQHYKLGGGQTSTSPILNLIPRTLIPTRTQGDTALRIYSGDDLFGIFDPSAAGITCANVFVLYNGTQVTEVDNTQNVDLFKPSFEFSAFPVPPFKIDPSDEEEADERLPSARDQRFKNPYALEDPLREAAHKENPTFKLGKTQMRFTIPYCVRSSKTWLRMFIEYNTTKCPGPAEEKGQWKQEFVFYAFQHFFPGTVPFCIRESTSPSAPPRHTIATGTNTCGTKHFKQIGVFYAYDNVQPSAMPPIDLDENNQPVPYLGKNPQIPAPMDPATATASAPSAPGAAPAPALTPAGAAAFTPPPAPNPLVEKIAPVDSPPPTQVMPITSQMDQNTFEWDSSKGVPGKPWKMFS